MGDDYSIVDGTNPNLPGLLFSTTEIQFDPNAGFTTSSPANLIATVGGIMDGQGILLPEPGPLTLVAAAGLGWLFLGLRKSTLRRAPRDRRA